jgi:hypothetical protein
MYKRGFIEYVKISYKQAKKTTVQTKTVDNLDSKTERERFKNRKFA